MALSVRSINCDASLVSPAGDVESLPLLGKQERSSSSSTSVRCRHDKAEDSKFFLVLVCIRTVVPLFLCATLLMINVVHTVHFLNKPSQVNNTCRHLLRNPNSFNKNKSVIHEKNFVPGPSAEYFCRQFCEFHSFFSIFFQVVALFLVPLGQTVQFLDIYDILDDSSTRHQSARLEDAFIFLWLGLCFLLNLGLQSSCT